MGLDAGLVHFVQEALELLQVEDALGLDVLRAGIHLLAQLVDLQEDGLIDRGHAGALVEPGRLGQVVAAAVLARDLHGGEHPQDAHGVQVVDGLGVGAVAHGGMVAGQGQHGINTEGGGGEHIAHDGHTAAVAAGHLQDGLMAGQLQLGAQAQRGGLEAGGLHIGDIDAVNLAVQQLGGLQLFGEVVALGRRHFCGDAKLSAFQCFL